MAVFQRLVPETAPQRRRAYPSALPDAQWTVLEPLRRDRAPSGPGRPPVGDLRAVLNALLYSKQTGCPWRYLPHDRPPRSSVHFSFEKGTAAGPLEEVRRRLRERVRRRAGRAARPPAGLVDSQTVKTAEARRDVGWDGGK
jgi:putative transposase